MYITLHAWRKNLCEERYRLDENARRGDHLPKETTKFQMIGLQDALSHFGGKCILEPRTCSSASCAPTNVHLPHAKDSQRRCDGKKKIVGGGVSAQKTCLVPWLCWTASRFMMGVGPEQTRRKKASTRVALCDLYLQLCTLSADSTRSDATAF